MTVRIDFPGTGPGSRSRATTVALMVTCLWAAPTAAWGAGPPAPTGARAVRTDGDPSRVRVFCVRPTRARAAPAGDCSVAPSRRGGHPAPGAPGPDPRVAPEIAALFEINDGVSGAQAAHAEAITAALPAGIRQALVDGGVRMELAPGFPGGAQGQNTASRGLVYVDSGLADQALVHEFYEMAARNAPALLKGSWNDPAAVALADRTLAGPLPAGDPGDLNDTVGDMPGDGDLMSNAFVADLFAGRPDLYQDTAGASVLSATVQDAPALVGYIARAFGLTDAASRTPTPTTADPNRLRELP